MFQFTQCYPDEYSISHNYYLAEHQLTYEPMQQHCLALYKPTFILLHKPIVWPSSFVFEYQLVTIIVTL